MKTIQISVDLDSTVVPRFEAALTGDDRDVLLEVEKAIVRTLYPERVIPAGLGAESVDLDPDLVNVTGAA